MTEAAERRANTIISMTNEAVQSGNEKLYWQALGYVEGMRRSGEFKDDFADTLNTNIKDEWKRKRQRAKDRFKKIWENML